ncbi:MAG: sensor histidine kinase [Parabacteroides sp.]
MKLLLSDKFQPNVHAISAIVALLLHFPEWMSLTDLSLDQPFPGMHLQELLAETLFAYLSMLLLFYLNNRLFHFHDPMSHIGWKTLISSVLLTGLLSNLMGKGFIWLHHQFGIPAIDAQLHHYLHPLRDGLYTIIITGSCYLMYLSRKSRQMWLENQELRTENLLNQYEALKNQLNPHMLFNTLNTLYSLIQEEPDKAQTYVQKLSRVLRYTLQDNDTHCVTLQEEMEFVNACIYLWKMRYEEKLQFEIRIDPDLMHCQLPPMSIQLLVENAVLHNEISNRHPLTIRITGQQGCLWVSNRIQPKRTAQGRSMGIGLDNLSKRFHLLLKKEIEIRKDSDCFTVTLPLS